MFLFSDIAAYRAVSRFFSTTYASYIEGLRPHLGAEHYFPAQFSTQYCDHSDWNYFHTMVLDRHHFHNHSACYSKCYGLVPIHQFQYVASWA